LSALKDRQIRTQKEVEQMHQRLLQMGILSAGPGTMTRSGSAHSVASPLDEYDRAITAFKDSLSYTLAKFHELQRVRARLIEHGGAASSPSPTPSASSSSQQLSALDSVAQLYTRQMTDLRDTLNATLSETPSTRPVPSASTPTPTAVSPQPDAALLERLSETLVELVKNKLSATTK
jgi:hypothetical protein